MPQKNSSDGRTIRDVVIGLTIDPDTGNASKIRQVIKDIKAAKEAADKASAERKRTAKKDADDEERALIELGNKMNREYNARLVRQRGYAAERARIDKEMYSRGLAMAKEYDRQITEQARAAERDRRAAERAAKRADADLVKRGTRMASEYEREEREKLRRGAKWASEIDRDNAKADRDLVRRGTRMASDYEREKREADRDLVRRGTSTARDYDKADRDLVRRGTAMAREYERDIRDREDRAQHFRDAAASRATRRDAEGQMGRDRMLSGGLRMARGIATVLATRNAGEEGNDTSTMIGRLGQIYGYYDTVVGSDAFQGARQTRMGRGLEVAGRRAIGAGARRLATGLAGSGIPGMSGLAGVGGGAATVAGAGAAAAVGVGAAAYGTYDFGRSIYNNGFMGGATPGGWSDTIGSYQNDAAIGIGNKLGVSAGWFTAPWNAKAVNEQQRTAKRVEVMQKDLVKAREATTARDAGEAARLPFETAASQVALEGRITNAVGTKTGLRANLLEQKEVSAEIKSLKAKQNTLEGPARKENEEQIRQLMQQQLNLAKEMEQIEKATAAAKLDSLKQQLSLSQANVKSAEENLKGNRLGLGSVDRKGKARIKNVLGRFRAQGEKIDNLKPEDLEILKGLGDSKLKKKIEDQQRAQGEAFGKELGIDLGEAGLSAAEGQRRAKAEQVRKAFPDNLFGATPKGWSPLQPSDKTMKSEIQVNLNIDRNAKYNADRVRDLVEKVLKEHGLAADDEATRRVNEAQADKKSDDQRVVSS